MHSQYWRGSVMKLWVKLNQEGKKQKVLTTSWESLLFFRDGYFKGKKNIAWVPTIKSPWEGWFWRHSWWFQWLWVYPHSETAPTFSTFFSLSWTAEPDFFHSNMSSIYHSAHELQMDLHFSYTQLPNKCSSGTYLFRMVSLDNSRKGGKKVGWVHSCWRISKFKIGIQLFSVGSQNQTLQIIFKENDLYFVDDAH